MNRKMKKQYEASKRRFEHYCKYEDEKTIQEYYRYMYGLLYGWFTVDLLTWEEFEKYRHEINIIRQPLKKVVE